MNPTLWRTCRVLAGETRLALLRLIVDKPDLTVGALAVLAGLSPSRASQELRRLQSRGLVLAQRIGPFVKYRADPDPQVPSAAPLLRSLHEAFTRYPQSEDTVIRRMAVGFSNTRRLAIVRILLQGARTFRKLHREVGLPKASLQRHVFTLRLCGLVMLKDKTYRLADIAHPFWICLTRLVQHPSDG